MSDINIPSELLWEIFLRVPAESLLRFRSVCKEWIRIIDDSSFIRAHALNINQLYSHTLLMDNCSEPSLYSISLDSLQFINAPQMIDAIHIRQLIHDPRLSSLFHGTFCNGLILMHSISDTTNWVIWNPLTNECHQIPLLPQIDYVSLPIDTAFGYDYDADDYIVVRIDVLLVRKTADNRPFAYTTRKDHVTHVYSLKLDSWRKIEDSPSSIQYCEGPGTFFNGTLYWPLADSATALALDLRTESFSELPLPPVDITPQELGRQIMWVSSGFRLDALDGCLVCSLENAKTKTFNGWMMKDYGQEQLMWIKLFSLQFSHLEVSGTLRLVAYLKRKGQVVLQHKRGFLWYDIGTNSIKKFSIHGFPDIDTSKIFPLSLVRLNVSDIAIGPKDVTTRKSRWEAETANTRLKFCVRDAGEMRCSNNFSCDARKCLLCGHKNE